MSYFINGENGNENRNILYVGREVIKSGKFSSAITLIMATLINYNKLNPDGYSTFEGKEEKSSQFSQECREKQKSVSGKRCCLFFSCCCCNSCEESKLEECSMEFRRMGSDKVRFATYFIRVARFYFTFIHPSWAVYED